MGTPGNSPENLIYGLIDMQIRTNTVGGTVTLTFYPPSPAPDDYTWFKYSSTDGWSDFSANVIFNDTRDQITLTLIDGGAGDDDGVANGIIVDPSGLGTGIGTASANPPTVTTGSATSLTTNSAILNTTVNPNGISTTYYFDYGTTTSYGSKTTETDAGSGTEEVSVSADITGLSEGTTYHFRLVAINSGGTSYGDDATFTTITTDGESPSDGGEDTGGGEDTSGGGCFISVM